MTMGDGEWVVGKVENGFELITKSKNMRLYLKGETLRNNTAVDILRTPMRESYYNGREVEILSLTKLDTKKDFAFITFTTKESSDDIPSNSLTYRSEHLKVSITKDKDTGYLPELRIKTTIIANNQPQRKPQSTITKALTWLFREEHTTSITFGYTSDQDNNCQARWCQIQCLMWRSTRNGYANPHTSLGGASTPFPIKETSMAPNLIKQPYN